MEMSELTFSEKTLIIGLIAKEIYCLESSNTSLDRIKDLESIIMKLEKM